MIARVFEQSFNSLCEIPVQTQAARLSWDGFQFSLWDSKYIELVAVSLRSFQFSLWDSPRSMLPVADPQPFNSLCEIRCSSLIFPLSDRASLSILFVRFYSHYFSFNFVRHYFQFSLWDSASQDVYNYDQLVLSFNSLCEILYFLPLP